MKYFETFTSNTVAGSGNQLYFSAEETQTGRVFYKITHGGKYTYSLLFSNIIDSTFADGSVSRKNLICRPWEIHGAKIGKLNRNGIPKKFTAPHVASEINGNVTDLIPLTFDEKATKTVAPGEFFTSDPVKMDFDAGDYLCLEMTVSGPMIPYHEESLLPAFVQTGTGWEYNRKTPFAGMIGCDRKITARIGYLGDSITQGIGTPHNSYAHWNALLSKRLGDENAYWNLGIGYGRADDLASDGAWLYKAKHNDVIVLCAGVNDTLRGFSAEQTIRNLTAVVTLLKKEGIKVILQTVPPFNYKGEKVETWNKINKHIRTVLAGQVDLIFDAAPLLGTEDTPKNAKYGGHPNAEGCKLWAEALYKEIRKSGILKGKTE